MVSKCLAGVSVSRQLLTAQLNLRSLKSDSEGSLWSELASRGLSQLMSDLKERRHVSVFPAFELDGMNSSVQRSSGSPAC